jgi:RNA polymerase sigma-70 factor (ECF subfamily)
VDRADAAGTPVDAFAAQLTTVRPALFRFAVALTSVSEADDLVQDAMTRGWARRDQFDARLGSVQAWLLAIVADQARARWRRPRLPDVHLIGELPSESVIEETAATLALDLAKAVNSLPPRQRLAIVLSVYVDLPLIDVATVMGCSLGTVKATLHTARKHLASALGATYALDR